MTTENETTPADMLELNRLHQLARHWQSEYETLWVDGNFADQSAECVQAWIAWDDAVTAANSAARNQS